MLSEKAQDIKNEMQRVVADKRELEAVEAEWRDLLLLEEERLCELTDGELPIITELFAERAALRKTLATHQLQNIVRLQHAVLTPLQRRVMRLRYVQGQTWTNIVGDLKKTKQYLLREHNKALETLAKREKNKWSAGLESDCRICDILR